MNNMVGSILSPSWIAAVEKGFLEQVTSLFAIAAVRSCCRICAMYVLYIRCRTCAIFALFHIRCQVTSPLFGYDSPPSGEYGTCKEGFRKQVRSLSFTAAGSEPLVS